MSDAERVRIGIVGAGIRGSMFARAVAEHPHARLLGVCDPAPGAAERTAKDHGVAAFGSHADLYSAAPDAVIVATPDFAHRDAVLAAAEAGIHVLVEKPLATTVQDATAMVDAIDAAGIRAMTGFENRWNPRFLAARQAIEDGSLGTVVGQILHLNDTSYVPTRMLSWSGRTSPVWFLLPHTVDLMIWLGGKRPVDVQARGVRKVLAARGIETWDSVEASFGFADGTAATVHSSWVLPESYPAVYDLRCEIVGTAGALRIEGAEQGLALYGDRLHWPQWAVQERGGKLHGFPVEMAGSFIEHVRGHEADVPSAADGLAVTRILAAVETALDTGRRIDLEGA